ncbi:MAG: cobyrinic acid a,c-diamide synthase [Rhodovulum sulfidophilum]|uniref:Hydrogenobyrinate a,c-diamide synthase n=1 Tax=Rhodovulum sulfidophilum TaxID=35806 RepID=A0A2W5Q346_RHOSU|nr:MAG: cobyrinic acid a,c-diamide synthase [Rhodovulum sulfidophilum]
MTTPGLLIAAPASGSGKTTVALGLARALTRDGLRVQPFKSGPDYIDPAFHAAATGRPSVNLDSWAMAPSRLAGLAARGADADLVLAEASMGLFDGVATAGETGTGASADLAALFGWPVVLVLDISGQAQSAAATALGFARFDPRIRLAGVILNKVASPRHEALTRAGMAAAGIAVLGALPRAPRLTLPERHLGLVQAGETADLEARLDALADFLAAHADLAAIHAAAAGTPLTAAAPATPPPGQRIALARDAAFTFTYPHLLQGWRAAGAEILPFSPLANEAPPEDADACWLPGGYPELHADALAAAEGFQAGLRRFAETRPVHGECGGYMAMGAALVDAEGRTHRMAGLLGLVSSFAKRRMHLGYRLATLARPVPGHGLGARLRGHEFHYASVVEQPDPPLAAVTDAGGAAVAETGSARGRATGTFFHLIAEAET